MTKIRPVPFWLLFFSPLFGFGQAMNEAKSAQYGPATSDKTNQLKTDRRTVFTVHRLTARVEPKKEPTYEQSIKGPPVSLPCPIQPQQLRQPR